MFYYFCGFVYYVGGCKGETSRGDWIISCFYNTWCFIISVSLFVMWGNSKGETSRGRDVSRWLIRFCRLGKPSQWRIFERFPKRQNERYALISGFRIKPYKNAVFPSPCGFPSALSFPNPLPFRIFTRLLWWWCSVSFGEFRLTSFASGLFFCTFQDYFVARYRNLHALALCGDIVAVLVSPPQAVTIGFVVCAGLLLPVYQASPVVACACPSDFALHCRVSLCSSFGLCLRLPFGKLTLPSIRITIQQANTNELSAGSACLTASFAFAIRQTNVTEL